MSSRSASSSSAESWGKQGGIILIDFREFLKARQTLSLDTNAHALFDHGGNKQPVEGNPLEFPIQTQVTDTLA